MNETPITPKAESPTGQNEVDKTSTKTKQLPLVIRDGKLKMRDGSSVTQYLRAWQKENGYEDEFGVVVHEQAEFRRLLFNYEYFKGFYDGATCKQNADYAITWSYSVDSPQVTSVPSTSDSETASSNPK